MQKRILISAITLIACFIITLSSHAQGPLTIQRADSLFTSRQYARSLDLYQQLLANHQYSPMMLLKMAYIQEGLQHLGSALYYLNLYYLVSEDEQALSKMEEMASKNNLEGYTPTETMRIRALLQENFAQITFALGSILIFLFAIIYYQKVKLKRKAHMVGFSFLFFAGLLFVHVNFSRPMDRGVIAGPSTYLMSGPSSGASVVNIIGEGHQLQITGKQDVWVKVRWQDKDVYVKENAILQVQI